VFRTLLIANRGEIALRIQRSARRMGLRTVAVYSEADRYARHAREADTAVCIGPAAPRASYLKIDALIEAARRSGADALHPGYGFLAESAEFAQAVLHAGLVWVGPSPAAIRAMGDKAEAKRRAEKAGVPVLPGYDGRAQDEATLLAAGRTTGFPLMVKAAAGGGGRGMRLVTHAEDLPAALAQARSEAESAFGDGRLLLERALDAARHVEVQVFADTHGACIHLGERDCSVQRRHQKLLEESPSPAVDDALRERMGAAAIAAARSADYVGAGTVEFLLDEAGAFWFMEMNTRLQVEHPVTECITGLDLVEWQLRVAAGEPLPVPQSDIRFEGHAIEVRLCAEDPAQDFLPQAGALVLWRPDACAVRIDHALETGTEIPPWYDSMIAKFVAHAPTRDAARERLAAALDRSVVLGVETNKAFLAAVLRDEVFARGGATTGFIAARRDALAAPGAGAAAFALAAVLGAALDARAAGHGEWTAWTNMAAREMRARLRCGTRIQAIALRHARDMYRATLDGATLEVRLLELTADTVRVDLDGRETTAGFARTRDALFLALDGTSLRFDDLQPVPPARHASGPADGRLVAPMNGRVAAVNASAGETVDAAHAVVVLEAMKMEHGLALGIRGRVTAVHVAPGAQVAPGQLLAEFEPTDA